MSVRDDTQVVQHAGSDLALLLLAGFRAMVNEGTDELFRRGHPDVRAVHEFAMRAIVGGADSAVELARTLSVTKQAAAKTIAALEERGYVVREADSADARRKRLVLTSHGHDMLATGEAIFNTIRDRWEKRIGRSALADMEQLLRLLAGEDKEALDTAGWLSGDES